MMEWGAIQTIETATRANKGCQRKEWQVLLWPIRKKVSRPSGGVSGDD